MERKDSMKSQKATIIKPKKVKEKEKENKNYGLIASIAMLIIGIILLTNSSKAVIIVCYCIGAVIAIFGGYNLLNYYRLKKELNIESSSHLIIGVIAVFIGMIMIILASAIETFLRFIIGMILIISGIQKSKNAIDYKDYFILLTGILLIAIGLYTILAENLVFAIVGLLLIISSIIDIIKYMKNQKK